LRRAVVLIVSAVPTLAGLLTALPAHATTTSASSLLAALTVRAESGTGSYARSAFAEWVDADQNSCDTREEVLIAESKFKVTLASSCRITKGKWVSWYDGRTWTQTANLDIDHMVPLKEAWESGARGWGRRSRAAFANDLGLAATLNAITDNLNSSKQDRDPAGWMPPRAHCKYAMQWVAVKYRWNLSVDVAEHAKLASVLRGGCGESRLTVPTRAMGATTTPTSPAPSDTSTATAAATPVPTSTSPSTPTYTPSPTYTVTPAPQPTYQGVTPGAFCGDHYAYGYTSAGTLMHCVTTATDTRFRWRAA
jgi:hypothetical protein